MHDQTDSVPRFQFSLRLLLGWITAAAAGFGIAVSWKTYLANELATAGFLSLGSAYTTMLLIGLGLAVCFSVCVMPIWFLLKWFQSWAPFRPCPSRQPPGRQ